MAYEQRFEPGAGGPHVHLGFFSPTLSGQHIGKAPIYLRIADRNDSPEQLFRLVQAVFRQANLGQMYQRLCVQWQDCDGPSIPRAGKSWVRLWGQFAPKDAELKANPGDRERRDVA